MFPSLWHRIGNDYCHEIVYIQWEQNSSFCWKLMRFGGYLLLQLTHLFELTSSWSLNNVRIRDAEHLNSWKFTYSFIVSPPPPNCCCSVSKSCLTPCDPMDCNTPGFLVFHYSSPYMWCQIHRFSLLNIVWCGSIVHI